MEQWFDTEKQISLLKNGTNSTRSYRATSSCPEGAATAPVRAQFWVEPDHFVDPKRWPKIAHDWSKLFEPAEEAAVRRVRSEVRGAFGLSGSPVWRLGASGMSARQWTPECSKLVGVITGWNAQSKILIATSASKLLEVSGTHGRYGALMSTAEKYLKPEVIRQVARLDLRAKFIVEGFIAGLHASPFQGFSVEFSEHRKYTRRRQHLRTSTGTSTPRPTASTSRNSRPRPT